MKDELHIQPLNPSDLDQAYTVAAFYRNRPGAPDQDRVRAFLTDENTYALVAWLRGDIAGLVVGYRLRRLDGDLDEFYVHSVEVASAFRREGVGRALMTHLQASLKERGFGEMWLCTETTNLAALALYDATGGQPNGGHGVIYSWTSK